MNDSEITYRVDQLIDLGKASAIRGWSMENILKIIQNEFGPEGYEIARTYIVRTSQASKMKRHTLTTQSRRCEKRRRWAVHLIRCWKN